MATGRLEIGYAYDHSLTRLTGFNAGSHEIMISYNFGREETPFVTPRYISYF